MMTEIDLVGKVHFDPADVSKKHERQSSWKSVATVIFPGDDHLFYSWLIKRRYGLALNKPLRGFHLTFVNDKTSMIRGWDDMRAKWEGTEVEVSASIDVRTNGSHWWLKVTDPGVLRTLREEMGLSPDPYWNWHITIGHPNERNIEHSMYLHRILSSGLSW
jgi:hypothetical protein